MSKVKAGLFLLLIKIGPKLLSLVTNLFKSAKLLKLGLATAAFGSYAAIFNWKFALLIMIAIGFHESGHVWAMKKIGIKTKGFYFLPFLGGVAISEDAYKSYKDNVYVSIMGPIWGCALAYVCAGLYLTFNVNWLAAAAGWMAMLNLFNLLPINPLDGGQILRSIAFSISKRLGLIILAASIIISIIIFGYLKIGLFLVITIAGGLELLIEYKNYKQNLKYKSMQEKIKIINTILPHEKLPEVIVRAYPDPMNLNEIIKSTAQYVGVMILLFILMFSMDHIPGADLAAQFLK